MIWMLNLVCGLSMFFILKKVNYDVNEIKNIIVIILKNMVDCLNNLVWKFIIVS